MVPPTASVTDDGVMDWATIAGAAVGGAIGLLGDLTGRLGSRRQAARQRKETLEDAETAYLRALSAEEARLQRERAHLAAERMLQGLMTHSANPLQPNDDVRDSANKLAGILYFEQLYIPDRTATS